jgi:hypothetical protein
MAVSLRKSLPLVPTEVTPVQVLPVHQSTSPTPQRDSGKKTKLSNDHYDCATPLLMQVSLSLGIRM